MSALGAGWVVPGKDLRRPKPASALDRACEHPPMSNTAENLSFADSRIYAQGWNAARCSSLKSAAELNKLAATNPCKTADERARWNLGFATGLK
jgi:hypothetical protein